MFDVFGSQLSQMAPVGQGSAVHSSDNVRSADIIMRMPASRSALSGDVIVDVDARRNFDALCAPVRRDLYRFLFWLCHDRSLAEDVMQETLLRAWRSFDSLRDRAAAKSWLLTIARRELARTFERKRVETVDIHTLTDAEHSSLTVADSHELGEMRRALMQLSPRYREPLIMQVLFGYSTEEIARHMDLGVQAVLTRLFRARQVLRRRMSEAATESPK